MNDYLKLGDYYDGYAKVKFADGKYGFVHLYGELLEGKYAEVEPFKNGVAFVKLDSGRWVTINTKGEFVRTGYTYDDMMREKEREENRYKLKQSINGTIADMDIYIDKLYNYLDKINYKYFKK
ncbi:MAG: WG repeat-containing protein [Spirochaetales bacterium]